MLPYIIQHRYKDRDRAHNNMKDLFSVQGAHPRFRKKLLGPRGNLDLSRGSK